jgi:glycosyltransferase involved in cell wall biosynthesis
MSRILWLGNPPGVRSGYGEQASLFVPRLMALGHELAVQCNWGVQGMTIDAGVPYYPSDNQWGNRVLGTFANHFRADHVIALCDAWVLRPDQWPDEIRVAVWAPVDHYPIPPAVLATLAHEKVRPIGMSRFGETLMADCGLDPLYVPHGVDRTVFHPRPHDRDAIRAELGIPAGAFLAGMVAANTASPMLPRKAFPQALLAFSRFAAEHDDAWLYVHSEAEPPEGSGISLEKLTLATRCPTDRVKFPPASVWHLGAPTELVSNLYQAFDVLLNPSMGEGFGIPILEAQACGCPVIASDHSAMTELTQAGWLVQGDPWWDALQDSFLIVPSVGSIYGALEAAYEARDDQELRAGASAFADLYDADLVTREHWVPALEAIDRPREVAPLAQQELRSALARSGR